MIRQFELVEAVKAYDTATDEDALNRAYVFAMKAHGSQVRASGDPYFSHPLEVAGILTTYKVDYSTIITALLHDTIEDTDATLADIQKLFGNDVARLVDGVTKLNQIEFQSDQAKQAENFRKLVLAMSEDIRVLLVKLADRLHNMRTLHHIKKPEKRHRIAAETMDIYAPLAERIGMQQMKIELENLAFAELNPDARASILRRLGYLRTEGESLIYEIHTELTSTLKQNKINATVSGREKSPYSIWKKMQQKDVGFEQLSDIMAFRIYVDTIEECYQTLGVAHSVYPVVPGRFRDYISTPKPNGYQSLHTSVLGPQKHRIELQIRTNSMHEIAENGVAAHWNYKQGGAVLSDAPQYKWLRELLDILEHTSGSEEFLEHTKLEMFHDQVFGFTPRGDLINLPRGATSVDFAYAVHSEVGDRCVGAKINGRMMPLRTVLKNGDQVEILTSKAQTPSPTWERFVITGKAKARIRRYIRLQEQGEYETLGRSILHQTFHDAECELNNKGLEEAVKKIDATSVEDLCAQVGSGNLSARVVLEAVFPGVKKKPDNEDFIAIASNRNQNPNKDLSHAKDGIAINGLIPGMAMHFAGCCHALPGDRIVGIISTGKGVTIHTIDCDSLQTFADEPERWLDVSWDQTVNKSDGVHTGRIKLTILNIKGSIGELTTLIAKNDANISNLKITNRTPDFYDILIDIEVHDVRHLNNIIAALRASTFINSADRPRG